MVVVGQGRWSEVDRLDLHRDGARTRRRGRLRYDDLRPLFAKFHRLTSPDGKVLASVLSPFFRGDLKYRWWWRNLPRLARSGRYGVPGAQASIVRRRLADLIAQSAPYFTLERVFRGLPGPHLRHPPGRVGRLPGRAAWLGLSTCRFMFVLFARREAAGLSGGALRGDERRIEEGGALACKGSAHVVRVDE